MIRLSSLLLSLHKPTANLPSCLHTSPKPEKHDRALHPPYSMFIKLPSTPTSANPWIGWMVTHHPQLAFLTEK